MTNVVSISKTVQNIPEEMADQIIEELEVLGSSDEPVVYLSHNLVAIFDATRNGYVLTKSTD